ncbi:MAG: hypothetical protein II277_02785, partial [Bacteroidales bacterium]|nr:hypothetical protein [Bacteroidales bacterium]
QLYPPNLSPRPGRRAQKTEYERVSVRMAPYCFFKNQEGKYSTKKSALILSFQNLISMISKAFTESAMHKKLTVV